MKKALAILLSILLLMACVPLGAIPALSVAAATWTLDDDGHLTISGSGALLEDYPMTGPWGTSITSVTIEHGITSIGDYVFSSCRDLTSVTIPSSVTKIGEGAFSGCWSLSSVTIPNGVKTIGSHAFEWCESFGRITIPDSVTTIGSGAFSYCLNLNTVTIGDGVTTIGNNAFRGCTSLSTLTIGDSVTTIGDGAFEDDGYHLADVYYGGSMADKANITIGENNDNLLYATWHYTEPEVPAGLLYEIANGEVTITGYTSDLPADVVIPSTIEGYPVTTIGESAFYDCTALTSVAIPDSVTTIGSRAFERDGALTTVTVGKGVTAIGQWAFASCYGLTAIVVDAANPKYSSVDGVLFNKDQTILIQYPNGKRDTSYTVPNGVTAIADWAFYNSHRYLTSVTISDSVTTIGADAFCWCDNLKSVSFGKNVTTIGDEAFYPMSIADVYYGGTEADKANITIGDRNSGLLNATWHYHEHTYVDLCSDTCYECGYQRTAPHAYDDAADVECNGCGYVRYLTYTITDGEVTITDCDPSFSGELVFPSIIEGYPVTRISSDTFGLCTSLTSVVIPDSVTYIGSYTFSGCTSLISATIPDSITTLGAFAFSGTALTSVTIPGSVASIGAGSFAGCTSLSSVIIKEGVTNIVSAAFANCTSLTSIVIPDGVTTLFYEVFQGCTNLTSVTLPASIALINGDAFSGCTALSDVYYGGTEADRANITIASGNDSLLTATWHYTQPVSGTTGDCTWTLDGTHLTISGNGAMGDYSWDNCAPWGTAITSVTIGNGVTAIGEYAFKDCVLLTTVDIPDSVTAIGYRAFYYCSGLVSVDIPEGVTVIKGFTFSGCRSLTSVTIPDGITDIWEMAFEGCSSLTSVTLPDSVRYISIQAFGACFNLTTITIPAGVTEISLDAFSGCTALSDVYYGGTEADRANISIGDNNSYLLNATWHYTDIAITYGDLNGDGGINNRDLVLMQRYLNGWDVTLDLAAADVCADGSINNRDLALLQRYINEWDVTLGPEPTIVLPEVGYDLDGRGRVVISAVEPKDNKVSFTFTNTSTRWMTEETCYIKYTCTDAEGNELTLNDTYYGYIYFGMLEAGWSKTLTITLPEGTAKMEFGDYRIIYWTQWV